VAARAAARELVKRSQQLHNKADVLMREAEVALDESRKAPTAVALAEVEAAMSQKSPATRTLLPILLQPLDRFADEDGNWEVINRPWSTRGGKLVHATVQKPGDPSTRRDKNWGAHERLAIRRG
jgi:hypothetical protein